MRLATAYHPTVEPVKLMEIVDGAAARIKNWLAEDGGRSISHIVATGSSGHAIAWPVSYKLGIPVCIVRKPCEESHDGLISGDGQLGDYIIIDDLISSGATLRRVLKAISDKAIDYGTAVPRCVGIFLYNSYDREGTWGDNIPVFTSRNGVWSQPAPSVPEPAIHTGAPALQPIDPAARGLSGWISKAREEVGL